MISRGPSIVHLAEFRNGYPFKPDELQDEGLPVIRIRHLLDAGVQPERAEPPLRAVYIDDGDLIFSWSATLAVRIWDRGRALLNQHLYRVDPHSSVDVGWFRYVLEVAVDRLQPLMHGSAMTHVTQDMLRLVSVALPPANKQRAIADYLDAEIARIDALIEKKRSLVALLIEKREAEISRLLWTGHFSRTRLKFLTGQPTSGNRDHGSFTVTEEGVPCLRGLNIRPAQIDRENLLFISPADHQRHSATELRSGDIVVVRSGLAGSAAVIPDDLDRCNCVDLVVVRRSQRLDPRYLEYVINSRAAQEQVRMGSSGALLTHFNADACANLVVPLRPLGEQESMRERLDKDTVLISRLLTTIDSQVVSLADHRQTLITAAVTGELDLPGVAA